LIYQIRLGDSLWKIALENFGSGEKWPTIAQDNHLRNPSRLLVGQQLYLRDSFLVSAKPLFLSGPRLWEIPGLAPRTFEQSPSIVPLRPFMFIIADEVNPFSKKVVRKVVVNPALATSVSAKLGRSISAFPNPEKFGLIPSDPNSMLPSGRHAMGMKPSPFISASKSLFGSKRIMGQPFWIDLAKAEAAGATVHGTQEILTDMDRIASKTKNATEIAKINNIKKLIVADAEVLIRGPVPPAAIKGVGSMAFTRGMQGLQVVGFVMTAVDLNSAAQKSVTNHSVKPITAEVVRQAGSWASTWAGMKLGASGGALLGIETGPGALLTGFLGGVVGGAAGYFGFDWIADHIDEN
jgi:LysM domain